MYGGAEPAEMDALDGDLPHHVGVSTIWLRRGAAVLVAFAFAVVLFAALTLQALNSTFARAEFYPEQLERADVYRFISADLADAFIEDLQQLDADEFGEDFTGNPVAASGLTTRQVADAMRRAFPPEDLEALLAPAFEQAAEYAAGERDEVTITIGAGGHIEALVRELTALMRESGTYGRLLDDEFDPMFREWADEALPPGEADSAWLEFLRGAETGDSLVRVFRRVVTPEWLADEVEQSADALTAYLVGNAEGFELRIELDDAQATAAAEELEAILGDGDAYDLARAAVIEPAVEEHVVAAAELPYGITLTREEARAALLEAVSPAWVEQQARVLARGVSAYVTGQADGFAAEIDLESVKADAAAALTDAATANLEASLRDLPPCTTAAEIAAARDEARRSLPPCIPPGMTASELASQARPNIAASIAAFIVEPVPDTVLLTESDLRDAIRRDGGDEALTALDDLRGLFAEGWTYTDADLRADLSDDDAATLDDVRSFLGEGYVIEVSAADDEGLEAALDDVREWTEAVSRARWMAFVFAIALLAAVGALGGMRWRGRVAWGAAALLAAAGPIALVSGPVYQAASGAVLDAIRDEIASDPRATFALTSELLTNKLIDIVEVSIDAFAGSIARNSLVLAALGAIALGVSLSWDRITEAVDRARS